MTEEQLKSLIDILKQVSHLQGIECHNCLENNLDVDLLYSNIDLYLAVGMLAELLENNVITFNISDNITDSLKQRINYFYKLLNSNLNSKKDLK